MEQQAGNGHQEVPVRNLMRIVSEGVGELVDAHKAKSAVSMLKDLISTSEPSPLEGLKHLKEAGLDLGTITGIHKEAAETFRSIAREERDMRREMSQEIEKAREEVQVARAEAVKAQMEALIQSVQSSLSEVRRLTEEARRPAVDPITAAIQQALADVLRNQVTGALVQQQKPASPLEAVKESLSLAEQLAEYFRARRDGDDMRREALVGGIKTEVLRLILEDERDREFRREQLRLERERMENLRNGLEALRGPLTELVAAVAEAIASRSAPPPPPTPSPPHAQPQAQPPPPQPYPSRPGGGMTVDL